MYHGTDKVVLAHLLHDRLAGGTKGLGEGLGRSAADI